MIGRSHILMAAALAACASGFGGFMVGVGVCVDREQAAQKRADDAAEVARRKAQASIDASTTRAQVAEQARQQSVRDIYHESQKIIERPVYRNVCVDSAGLGLLDHAAATANSEDIWGVAGDTRPIAQGPAD